MSSTADIPDELGLVPDGNYSFVRGEGATLLITCGALAREVVDLIELNHWRHLDVDCLPAIWHNTPEKIPEGVRAKILGAQGRYEKVFVLYGDCGTGGALDKVLAEEGVERIEGPHCYSFFAGNAGFLARSETEFTAFYLTDYFARHFDKLVWQTYHLDRPGMRDFVFGNYEKVVYIAQTEDPVLQRRAEEAAEKLGLAYEYRFVGYGDLRSSMQALDLPEPGPA